MATKLRNRETGVMDHQCGKSVDPDKALKLHWEGTTYYFCSERCRTQFEADPPGVAGF